MAAHYCRTRLGKSGVYAIQNRITGKVYVGSTTQMFGQRFRQHQRDLCRGKHCNSYLQRTWNKWGEQAFQFLILEECEPEGCIGREQHWIDRLRAADRNYGYNLWKQAGNSLGMKRSPEMKAKLSAYMRNLPPEVEAERVARLREAGRQWRLTPEGRDALRQASRKGAATLRRNSATRRPLREAAREAARAARQSAREAARNALREQRLNRKQLEKERRKREAVKNYRARMARLTEDQVREIRQTYIPSDASFGRKALAAKYGVSVETIKHILYRRRWKDL